jgi:hypothetical protein
MPAHTEDRIPLPEIVVGAPTTRPTQAPAPTQTPANAEHERCVDVKIGEDHSLGCLNERLRRQADSSQSGAEHRADRQLRIICVGLSKAPIWVRHGLLARNKPGARSTIWMHGQNANRCGQFCVS